MKNLGLLVKRGEYKCFSEIFYSRASAVEGKFVPIQIPFEAKVLKMAKTSETLQILNLYMFPEDFNSATDLISNGIFGQKKIFQ